MVPWSNAIRYWDMATSKKITLSLLHILIPEAMPKPDFKNLIRLSHLSGSIDMERVRPRARGEHSSELQNGSHEE